MLKCGQQKHCYINHTQKKHDIQIVVENIYFLRHYVTIKSETFKQLHVVSQRARITNLQELYNGYD